jgi:drug/metabolite transporter (DMT)-like permease
MDKWILLAIIGTFISSFGVILMKCVDNSKYDNVTFMVISYIIVGLFGLLYVILNFKNKKKILKNCDYLLILYALLFASVIVFGNIIIQYAFSLSPNISYTHIIINLNIIFTILVSYIFFKEYINIYCFIGILISLIGIFIIGFNYNK